MDEKKENKALVADESLPYVLMDLEDENQILAEMRGEVMNAFVYSYPDKKTGREVTGLSKVGVDNVCRESANKGEVFRVIGDPVIRDSEDAIEVVIKVGRFAVNPKGTEIMLDTTYGAKRQPKQKKSRDGKLSFDPFFFETAMSKAERNAKRKLLPENLIIEMIKKYRAEGKVKRLSPQERQQEPLNIATEQYKEEIHKFASSKTIDTGQAKLLNDMRFKHFGDTVITKEMLMGFIMLYDAKRLSDIKTKDFDEILGAVQDRDRFDELTVRKKEQSIEKEKDV